MTSAYPFHESGEKMGAITFGSLCSGIEAASEAWLPLGWECAYVAEVEPLPCSYLAQTYGARRPLRMPSPDGASVRDARAKRAAIKALEKITFGDALTNFGDVSQIGAAELPAIDIIAAGFPCQDFSIAGLRASLGGHRGNLSTIGVRLLLEAADLGLVRGAVLEQVPDVLNTEDNAWGNILGALVGSDVALKGLDHGGKWPRSGMVAGPRARVAWRILDAQYFGLAQRRERVWAIVDFGDGPDPAAVLFEPKGMFGDHAQGCRADEDVAPTLAGGARQRGGYSTDDIPAVPDGRQWRAAFGGNNTSGPIDVATARTASHTASGRQDFATETFVAEVAPPLTHNPYGDHESREGLLVAHSLRGEGFDASEDGTGRGTPIVPVAIAIQERAVSENPDAGPDGLGVKEGTAYTLEGRPKAQAVAYSIMPQNSGKDYKAREVDVAQPLMAGGPVGGNQGGNQGGDYIVQPIAFNSREDPVSPSEKFGALGGSSPQAQAIAFSLRGREGGAMPEVEAGDVSPALRAAEGGSTRPFIAFDETQITSPTNRSNPREGDPCHPLTSQGRPPTLASTMAVRRITCVEAEILQGFRPNATLIHWPSANRKAQDLIETIAYLIGHGYSEADAKALAQTPDGPRYKAIGNSWPVPVARWIGERIARSMPPRRSRDGLLGSRLASSGPNTATLPTEAQRG